MHKRLIRVTDEFKHAVEEYRKAHNINSWNYALVVLASQSLGIEANSPKWGGERRKKDNNPAA